jgi:hypothetical protein
MPFAAADEACDLSLRVALEDSAKARLAGREQHGTHPVKATVS